MLTNMMKKINYFFGKTDAKLLTLERDMVRTKAKAYYHKRKAIEDQLRGKLKQGDKQLVSDLLNAYFLELSESSIEYKLSEKLLDKYGVSYYS